MSISSQKILHTFERAPDSMRAAGLDWYPNAYAFAQTLDKNVEKAVGVIAALSPRQHWETNKQAAIKVLKAAQRHSNIIPSVPGTYRNV